MRKKILLLPLIITSVGTAIWLFIQSLAWVIAVFQEHWFLLLPGLVLISLVYGYLDHFHQVHRFGDTESLLQEVKEPRNPVHWMLAPWIFLWTLLFHLFGASVGRESTAIQIGGSLAESLGRLFRVPTGDRPIVIRMGLAAGFAAAFGVPWTGFIFALESPFVLRKKDWLHWPLLWIASWGAFQWTHILGLKHSLWKTLEVNLWDFGSLPYLEMCFFFVGLSVAYDLVFRNLHRLLKRAPWWIRFTWASVLIFVFTFIVGQPTYNNLGEALIHSSFSQPTTFMEWALKLGFTFISTVSGMKGGEVTPLMASGSLYGSWVASHFSLMTFQFGAAIGLVSLFSSRLRVPVSGIFMLWEFFDWKIALLGAPILLLTAFGQKHLLSKFS